MLRLQGRSPFCQEIQKKRTMGVQQGTLQILNCTIEEWKFHTLVWVITLSLVTPQSYSVIFPDDEFEVTWLENGTTIKVFSNHKLKHESLWNFSVTCCHGAHEYCYHSVNVGVQEKTLHSWRDMHQFNSIAYKSWAFQNHSELWYLKKQLQSLAIQRRTLQ